MAAKGRTGEVSLIRSWSAEMPELGWAPPAASGPMDEPTRRCLDMWRCVLLTMVDDSISTRFHDAARNRDHARLWLTARSADRALVFDLAGVDLGAFLSRGLPRLRERWKQVDAVIAAKRAARKAREREASPGRAVGREAGAGAPVALQAA